MEDLGGSYRFRAFMRRRRMEERLLSFVGGGGSQNTFKVSS